MLSAVLAPAPGIFVRGAGQGLAPALADHERLLWGTVHGHTGYRLDSSAWAPTYRNAGRPTFEYREKKDWLGRTKIKKIVPADWYGEDTWGPNGECPFEEEAFEAVGACDAAWETAQYNVRSCLERQAREEQDSSDAPLQGEDCYQA